MKSLVMVDKDLFIMHGQYHGCCGHGTTRSQDIRSNGIDVIILEYSDF